MRCKRISRRYTVKINKGDQSASDSWFKEKTSFTIIQTSWHPAADIYETTDAIHIIIDLAGVNPKLIDISAYDDVLVIEGRRYLPHPEDHGESIYHRAEIRQGSFQLILPLTTMVHAEKAEAKYEQGLLFLMLPKDE